MQTRVLVVDDDLEMRDALGAVFARDGRVCDVVASATAALDSIGRRRFDAVVCDVRMEGMSGLDLLERVKKIRPTLPVILMTGAGKLHDAVEAIKRGAFQYVTKPFDADALRAMVDEAVSIASPDEVDRSTRAGPPLTERFDSEIVGDGPAMRALQSSIDRVALSSAPVLVTGETGVGKELVARAIHARGERSGRAFVAVNTSAIQESLFESELFGHSRGSFTGALQARHGLITEADKGTLFLDEIGDMPIGMQAKLLRVLQFGEVRPVGSDRAHRVDVRVIAATHRDLPLLVREGRFREDLYFRLNVLPIAVPPLRAHRDDIPALARHFLSEACRRVSRTPVRSIGEEALRVLSSATWPGNVRELASAIERAVVFSSDETIGPEHLACTATGAPQTLAWPSIDGTPWTMQRLNQAYAEWVLDQTGGNKRRAAEILGVDLSTLYRWRRTTSD
jgi:two-component system, NtrC family, response regulator HydG